MIDPNFLCLGCMNELSEGAEVCEKCGWNNEADENKPHQLKCGTVLQGKYLVGKVLGEGGFGITYLGWDLFQQKKVAIKEFYLHGFVGRDTTVNSTVMPYVGHESFAEKSKDGFIKEAKTLSSLSKIGGIVEMRDVFAENQTVYIVMEYVEGITLKEYVKQNGNKLPMSTVLELLSPVMDALEQVHAHGLIHRDISPDNIMVGPDGKVTLLDLGAARQISADGGHSLTVNVKHGYAPMEQYQTHGEQGPWTDIYALCATIYRLITGSVPPSSADRIVEDTMSRPSDLGADITEKQERVLLKGLAPKSQYRYLNIFELRNAFELAENDDVEEEMTVPLESDSEEVTVPVSEEERPETVVKNTEKKNKKAPLIAIAIVVVIAVIAAAVMFIKSSNQSKSYDAAIELMEARQYTEAILAFEELGDYKDSSAKLAEVITEAEKVYNAANGFYEDGKYDEAISEFEKLGAYSDSADRIEEIKKTAEKKEAEYSAAEKLESEGKYEEAAAAFKAIGDYKDSKEKAEEITAFMQNAEQAYLDAIALMEAEKFDEAAEAFAALGNYKDSAEQAKTAKEEASIKRINIAGKNYKATYLGTGKTSYNGAVKRDFYLVDVDYRSELSNFPLTGGTDSVLPESNYPVKLQKDSTYAVEYLDANGKKLFTDFYYDTGESTSNYGRITTRFVPEYTSVRVDGKSYSAVFCGEVDISSWAPEFKKREFYKIFGAYNDMKDNAITNNVLPYNNYPVDVKEKEVYMIKYYKADGTTDIEIHVALPNSYDSKYGNYTRLMQTY